MDLTNKTKLFPSSELKENESRGFEANGRKYFALRQGGQLFCYLNACPHLGIPLEWQEHQFLDSDNELIQCSTHGALFTISTGDCVSGPCAGDHLSKAKVYEYEGYIYF